jgi:cytochrome c-type biogenesis protein CcmH/NrfG
LDQALRQFAEVAVDPTAPAGMVEMNTALMASAEGDWSKATQILQRVLDDDPDNFAVSVFFGFFPLIFTHLPPLGDQ